MTDFRGPRNIQIGFPVWAGAQYDPESRDYVVSVEGDDVERFRAIADGYGFREDGAEPTDEPVEGQGHERHYVDLAHAIDNARDDEPEPPHDPPADGENAGDDDVPNPGQSDDESTDDTEPTPDPEPTPEPAAPKRRTRRPR